MAKVEAEPRIKEDLETILSLIKARTGHDFLTYKESTMYRRISKKSNSHRIENLHQYIRYLQKNPEEIDELFQEILINVTCFFRNPEAFDIIESKTLPELIVDKNEGDTLRIWVPGCSNGEEAYSLAIIIQELMESRGKHLKVQIFGTDIDETTIENARKRIYPENISENINPERLKKFFIKKEGKYQVKDEIRKMIVFAVHDVLKDPPFAKLDMISCRNLLIYLKSDAQKILLSTFDYALNKEGILFLGPSESIGESLKSFQVVDKKWKIFKSGKTNTLPLSLMESSLKNEKALKYDY